MLNLNEMKAKELKEMAKQLKVKDWWNLKKEELIDRIADAIGEETDSNPDYNVEEAIQINQDDAKEEPKESIVEEEKTSQNEPKTTEDKPKKKQDLIEYNGKTQNLSAWAKELGIPGQTLYARLHISNWSIEKAFTTPSRRKNKEEA